LAVECEVYDVESEFQEKSDGETDTQREAMKEKRGVYWQWRSKTLLPDARKHAFGAD
jgi:hypothetical protein